MRTATLIGFLIFATLAFTQSWCPPGAVWGYDTGNPWFEGQAKYMYTGDTVVDGHSAQRITQWTQMIWQGTFIENGPAHFFTRTDGDVVWEWNGAVWDTLYWFSAVPGDHWQPFWPFGEDCPDHAWHVTDTATVIIDDVPLRRIWVEMRENGELSGNWTMFTERIGGGGGFIFPGLPPCGAIYECYCTYGCYRDDEINSDNSCMLTLALTEAQSGNEVLQMHPNPGNTTFQLSGLGHRPAHLRLLDLQGRVVLTNNLMDRQPVDTSTLPTGAYLVEVSMDTGRRVVRWVKE